MGLLERSVSRGTGILPVRPGAILALETKDLHGQDGRATHGRDAHATFFSSLTVPIKSRLNSSPAATARQEESADGQQRHGGRFGNGHGLLRQRKSEWPRGRDEDIE